MADLKKILRKLKDKCPEDENLDPLSQDEAAGLEGGVNVSCQPVNSSCPPPPNTGCNWPI